MKNWDGFQFMFIETVKDMEKIIKMNGYVYLVEGWDKKGFETYHYLGKDIDDPRWGEKDNEEKPKQKKGKIKKEED